jgi:hypothetical protein
MDLNSFSIEEFMHDARQAILAPDSSFDAMLEKYQPIIHEANTHCHYLVHEHIDRINNKPSESIDHVFAIILFVIVGNNPQECKHAEFLAYLRSSEWKEKAHRIKEKYGSKCAICNSSNKLNVHHRTYENLYHEKDEDLICLCNKCHSKFHDKVVDHE